ncbi:hypothetical protein PG989_000590 [Apiospora arundinis]
MSSTSWAEAWGHSNTCVTLDIGPAVTVVVSVIVTVGTGAAETIGALLITRGEEEERGGSETVVGPKLELAERRGEGGESSSGCGAGTGSGPWWVAAMAVPMC